MWGSLLDPKPDERVSFLRKDSAVVPEDDFFNHGLDDLIVDVRLAGLWAEHAIKHEGLGGVFVSSGHLDLSAVSEAFNHWSLSGLLAALWAGD